jgi:hypothetical protein
MARLDRAFASIKVEMTMARSSRAMTREGARQWMT